MSYNKEDRWQLSWLPLVVKRRVIHEFHELDARLDFSLWNALGVVPDHEIASAAGVSPMHVSRMRFAVGVPFVRVERGNRSNADIKHEHGLQTTWGLSAWPGTTEEPRRRNCTTCAHWGPEKDPDYDECLLAGDELLQAHAWFTAVGGRDGTPPHENSTGCPHWQPVIDWKRHEY